MTRFVLRVCLAAALVAAVLARAPARARAQALPPAGRADELPLPEGTYLDPGGTPREFEPTYRLTFSAASREPKYGWAALEMVGLLGIGTAIYWLEPETNKVDWDFPNMWDRLKWGEGMRFDNNHFSTNFLGHVGSGSAYYGFSRANGLSVPMAALYAVVSSFAWEYGLEWREKVSINDMVFTPFCGVPGGELFFQLGRYLNSAPSGAKPARPGAAYTLGLPVAIHEAGYGRRAKPAVAPDNLGLSSAYWHRFGLAYTVERIHDERGRYDDVQGVDLGIELVAMPGYLQPGTFATGFGEGNFTEGRLHVAFDKSGTVETDLRLDAYLAGWYGQHVVVRDGGLWGYSAMAAFHMAYRYVDRDLLDRPDRYAVAHFAGPAAQVKVALRSVWLEAGVDLHADFAAVEPAAYDNYVGRHGNSGLKSVLRKEGYVYAMGWSTRVTSAVRVQGCELAGSMQYGWYDSLEGLDRNQEQVTRDVSSRDQMLEARAWVGCAPVGAVIDVRFEVATIRHWGRMADVTDGWWDRRLGASFGVRF